jgi:predicted protein tyrosine phosphatase
MNVGGWEQAGGLRMRKDYGEMFLKPFQNIPLAAFSIEEMENLLENPFDGYVLSLREPISSNWYMKIDKLAKKNCKGMLVLEFEDSDHDIPGCRVPQKEDVEAMLKWSKDIDITKDKIAVHCTAGVSRSSASAYIIACSKMPIEKALGCLCVYWHDPNWRIVGFGADILGSDVYNKAREKFPSRRGYE